MNDKQGPKADSEFVRLVEKMRNAQERYRERPNRVRDKEMRRLQLLVDTYTQTFLQEEKKFKEWQKMVKENGGDNGTFKLPLL